MCVNCCVCVCLCVNTLAESPSHKLPTKERQSVVCVCVRSHSMVERESLSQTPLPRRHSVYYMCIVCMCVLYVCGGHVFHPRPGFFRVKEGTRAHACQCVCLCTPGMDPSHRPYRGDAACMCVCVCVCMRAACTLWTHLSSG